MSCLVLAPKYLENALLCFLLQLIFFLRILPLRDRFLSEVYEIVFRECSALTGMTPENNKKAIGMMEC